MIDKRNQEMRVVLRSCHDAGKVSPETYRPLRRSVLKKERVKYAMETVMGSKTAKLVVWEFPAWDRLCLFRRQIILFSAAVGELHCHSAAWKLSLFHSDCYRISTSKTFNSTRKHFSLKYDVTETFIKLFGVWSSSSLNRTACFVDLFPFLT